MANPTLCEVLGVQHEQLLGETTRLRRDAVAATEFVAIDVDQPFADRLTEALGGAKIYLKREDLNHTGAHKINNTMGQALLARRMGKKRIIAGMPPST